MSWANNNSNNGQQPSLHNEEHMRAFSLLQQTPNNIPLPSPFTQFRGRLNSVNSSFLSPMRLITSPNMHDADNLFQFQLRPTDKDKLEKFSLDDGHHEPIQEDEEQARDESESMQFEQQVAQPQNIAHIMQICYQASQLIRAVAQNLGIDDTELQRQRKKYLEMQDQQYLNVFDMLARKMRKVKKTKEEMIKYCMRKVFRHLSEKIRNQLSVGPRDNSECMKYYFGKYQNDKSFNVPFKKNSVEKTMNSNFLAKVFTCPLFVEDYRRYMSMSLINKEIFRTHAQRDNAKKIDALAKVIAKSIQTKNMRKIDTFKRLPWTQLIINKSEELAKSLLEYAKMNPPAQMDSQKQSPPTVSTNDKREQDEIGGRHKIKQIKKGSIILLTPPMGPLSAPHIEDRKLEQILKL